MTKPKIALLIDAENISAEEIEFAISDAEARGQLLVRKAFGNLNSLKAREAVLAKHSCTAEIVFQTQKNAADMLIAITAERYAAGRQFDEIAVLSHDRDFSTVAAGLSGYGVKISAYRRKTPRTTTDKSFSKQVFLPDRSDFTHDLKGFRSFVNETLKKAQTDVSVVSLRKATQKAFGKDFVKEQGFKDFPSLLSKAGFLREIASGGIKDGRVAHKTTSGAIPQAASR